jgi:hypothetical protein|tara:strand:- start:424 stop:774 length:351 start_codon:yes stop_codon:yes gene_type:complete
MKKVSTKQAKENRELRKVYERMAEERGHYCTGCGRSGDVALSHSHIIPRSRRKDLVLDPRNITYHCLDGGGGGDRKGCHQLWEGGITSKSKLLDYHANLEYILEVDAEYYFILTEL